MRPIDVILPGSTEITVIMPQADINEELQGGCARNACYFLIAVVMVIGITSCLLLVVGFH